MSPRGPPTPSSDLRVCLSPHAAHGKSPDPGFPPRQIGFRHLRAESQSGGDSAITAVFLEPLSFFADAPKLQGPVAVYTWEGNQVNITCEVFAYPSATISWFRDGQLLPSSNYSNIKIYNTPSASYLEVRRCGGGGAVQELWSECGQAAGYS